MARQFVMLCGLFSAVLLQLQCGSSGAGGALASPQRAAYSLQAAVDELHRREAAKYPLNAPPAASPHYFAGDLDDWDEDSDLFGTGSKNKNRNRHRINKALAKYLERESYEADHGGLSLGPFGGYEFDEEHNTNTNNNNNNENNNLFTNEKKKRMSLFRERDEQQYGENSQAPATSVFRERENQAIGDTTHSELTEQFLREIEEEHEHERQERYKAALRQLWEKYQQQENEIGDNREDELFEQKKRMRMPPYYLLMQKKRSYPVLPWLPYNVDKKKRFPVAKRSAKRSTSEVAPMGKTDEKVAQELSELFGKPELSEEKKKRSTDDQVKTSATTNGPETTATTGALGDMRLEINFQRVNLSNANAVELNNAVTTGGGGEMLIHANGVRYGERMAEKKHRKRSDHMHHSEESEEGHDEHDEEGEESSDEDDHDEFDEDDEAEAEERRKKKKRDASSRHLHSPTVGHLMLRAKKSIDWSQYFGLDRKKKSLTEIEEKKRSDNDDDGNAIANDNDNNEDDDESRKKKRDIDPDKLDSMDKKLQSIEDFIIDETIKYTGAHEGIVNQDEIRKLKDHVLSRLATAYSLEKMRRALDKLRQSVENENHLLRNVIEPESEENGLESSYWSKTNKKRFSVKKEQPDDADTDVNASKKKKRSGYLRYPEQPIDRTIEDPPFETLNDAYLGNKNYIIGSNQCPIIESMAERCRGIDLIAGDLNQELLPLCGVHQICYLCGVSQVACDYQYLAETDSICGNNNDCQAAARSVLLILRGTPGTQLGPRECVKNPCLYSAMREIGL